MLAAPAWPAEEPSVRDVYAKVKDAVVVVRTLERTGADQAELGIGSGVLIAPNGRVLTAAHVVQVADAIVVEMPDGQVIPARVTASQPSSDLAVLELERPPTKSAMVPLGDSDKAQVGDRVLVIGAPLGMTRSLSVGYISGRRTENTLAGGFGSAELLQTDAAINSGNSGGPMFNLAGEVIGIVSHIISQSGGFEGLGFVAASNTARGLLDGTRGVWSGMDGYRLEGELARVLQVPQPRAILVQRVAAGSPAAELGLIAGTVPATIAGEKLMLGGDVILAVSGINLGDADGFAKLRAMWEKQAPGGEITLLVLRGGRKLELTRTPSPKDGEKRAP